MIHALAGAVAGLVHVLSGPDHLAAVTPLAAAGPRRSWRLGALWGAGHTSGVWLVAIAALLLRGVLPIERLSAFSERAVGVVLIGLGLWGLRLALGRKLHAHVHTHEGVEHTHFHAHESTTVRAPVRASHGPHVHGHAAIGVGILHGLAGSAHFLAVLPALALPTTADALTYVGGYGVGTVLAMTGYASCIGAIAGRFARGPAQAYRVLLGSCAIAALAVGCFWLLG